MSRRRWSVTSVEEERARLQAHCAETGATAEQFAWLRKEAHSAENEADPLRRLVVILELLGRHVRGGGLADGECADLLAQAEATLKLAGIEPYTSKLGFLYGELQRIRGAIQARQGGHERAAWEVLAGERMAQRSASRQADGALKFDLAHRALRRGHADFAIRTLEGVAESAEPQTAAMAREARLRALRLCGERATADRESSGGEGSKESWERVMVRFFGSRDPEVVFAALAEAPLAGDLFAHVYASLFAKAVPSRSFLDRPLRARTLKRKFPDQARSDVGLGVALNCLERLEDVLDRDLPAPVRLGRLREALDKRTLFQDVEGELFLLAACARGLARMNQSDMAAFVSAEYRALCLTLSDGRERDVLGLIDDLMDSVAKS